MPRTRSRRAGRPLPLLLALALNASAQQAPAPAAAEKPFKIGVVTFLSGAAAGPIGVPARNPAEVLVEPLNAGKAPGASAHQCFGGRAREAVCYDRAGGRAH